MIIVSGNAGVSSGQLDERAPGLSEAPLLDLHGKKGNAFTSLRVSVVECNVWKKDETSSNELQ